MYPSPPIRHDPSIGKFIQADSIVPTPGNPQSLNRYAYVDNNPLRYTDPSGRFGDDMHADMTLEIAIEEGTDILTMMHGMDVDAARRVATAVAKQIVAGNAAVDDLGLHRDTSLRPDRGNPHFLAHAAAQDEMTRVVYGGRELGTPEEFGRALHSIQDYYRHRGLGYTPGANVPGGGSLGQHQYLLDVIEYGEAFDLGTFILHAPQPGHGVTSFLTRYVSELPGLGFLGTRLAEPDALVGTYPRDVEAIEETRHWIRQYLTLWFASRPRAVASGREMPQIR